MELIFFMCASEVNSVSRKLELGAIIFRMTRQTQAAERQAFPPAGSACSLSFSRIPEKNPATPLYESCLAN
jgi:hypothetical protein